MEKKKKNINFKTVFLLIMAVIIGLLVYGGIMLLDCYKDVTELENGFYNSVKATSDFHNSSGKLNSFTAQYAQTGQLQFMEKYFEELDSKNREEAAHILKAADEGLHASKASDICVKLMDSEFHVMKLVAIANGVDEKTVRSEISGYILPPDEQHMSSVDMIGRARSIISGNDYMMLKSEADREIGLVVGVLVEKANEDISRKHDNLTFFILFEIALGVSLIAFFVLSFVHNSKTVEVPLKDLLDCTTKGALDEKETANEVVNDLSKAYNRNITEIKQLRKKVNTYQNAILMDAVSVANINLTTAEFVDISLEDEDCFLSRFLKQIGVVLPCDYSEYSEKALPFIGQEYREEFEQVGPETIISLYANGQKYLSGQAEYLLEGEKYMLKVDSIISKDPQTSEIMAMVIFRKMR